MSKMNILATMFGEGIFVGRMHRPGLGASVITLRGGDIWDITEGVQTVANLINQPDAKDALVNSKGDYVCSLDDLAASSLDDSGREKHIHFLAPCDLQPVKACGVTFVSSMLERVIDERSGGDAAQATRIREDLARVIQMDLGDIVPGSVEARTAKEELTKLGWWSQYLEVGLGPDAEIFTKAAPMASVGYGAQIGIHPMSAWNNSEPEIVLAMNSRSEPVGATLGNDVNLRDVEGRSALLLGRAKDNNASSAIGPFVRLFDDTFTLDHVRDENISLRVDGEDGFVLKGASSMNKISRDPLDLISHASGDHHQYPDGYMLFLGTLFAPTEDRDEPGGGFTHKVNDVVKIASPHLGELRNTVVLCTDAPPWTYGLSALFRDLQSRQS